jgi:selenide,water dikinase
MIEGTDVGMVVHSSAVPVFPEAKEFATMGLVPAGTYRNQEFRSHMIETAGEVSDNMLLILFDAQTSGGLLISAPSPEAEELLEILRREGIDEAAIIGEIVAEPKGKITVK